jgi:toxin FitB
MIILDTNVLSALMRNPADPAIVRWLDGQPRRSVWTTSVTILEILFGIGIMAEGRRRSDLHQAFDRLVDAVLEQRVAGFDGAAAEAAAALMAERRRGGRPVDLRDTMIAGIVAARYASLATGNSRHFVDLSVPIVNPWQT